MLFHQTHLEHKLHFTWHWHDLSTRISTFLHYALASFHFMFSSFNHIHYLLQTRSRVNLFKSCQWETVACGRTPNQLEVTEKARNFLKQLTTTSTTTWSIGVIPMMATTTSTQSLILFPICIMIKMIIIWISMKIKWIEKLNIAQWLQWEAICNLLLALIRTLLYFGLNYAWSTR